MTIVDSAYLAPSLDFLKMLSRSQFMMFWTAVFLVDLVYAVETEYVEFVFAGISFTSAIVAVYAATCTLDIECDSKFFDDMRSEGWSKARVNDYLDDMGFTGTLKTVSRNRLLVWITGGGDTDASSSAKKGEVKTEPDVAAERARSAARDASMSEADIINAGKDAMIAQMIVNERMECTSVYARALRAEGGEGVKIDRALMGEDTENMMVEEEDGSVVMKRPTSASVADKWKTMEDAQEGIAEMQMRASEDGKEYIVQRLRKISDYLMLLSVPKRLPYVKRLFKSFYQGIPVAENDKVMRKVTNDWEAESMAGARKNTGSEDNAQLKAMKIELAQLKQKLADKKPATETKERKCHLCRQPGHLIADCPSQCLKCSSPGQQVLKTKCECVEA